MCFINNSILSLSPPSFIHCFIRFSSHSLLTLSLIVLSILIRFSVLPEQFPHMLPHLEVWIKHSLTFVHSISPSFPLAVFSHNFASKNRSLQPLSLSLRALVLPFFYRRLTFKLCSSLVMFQWSFVRYTWTFHSFIVSEASSLSAVPLVHPHTWTRKTVSISACFLVCFIVRFLLLLLLYCPPFLVNASRKRAPENANCEELSLPVPFHQFARP